MPDEIFERKFDPEKEPYMTEEYVVNTLLGDSVGEMMQHLRQYKEEKKPSPDNKVFNARVELVQKLLTAYDYIHLRKHWDNINLRRKIQEFDKQMQEIILDDGQLPQEPTRKQLLKFGDIYSIIENINQDSEVLSERYKIEILTKPKTQKNNGNTKDRS